MEWVNPLTHRYLGRNMTRLPNAANIHLIAINNVITIYPLQVAKYVKNEFRNLKENGEGLVMFKFAV